MNLYRGSKSSHKTNLRRILVLSIFMLFTYAAQSQLLIALLFGDKLNSEKLGFGLNAGVNVPFTHEIDNSKTWPSLELGLFFDVRVHDNFIFRPEIYFNRVYKISGLSPYNVADFTLDDLSEYKLQRQISSMGIGAISSTRVFKYLYFDFGLDGMLLTKAVDKFYIKEDVNSIELNHNFTKKVNRIDFGINAGFSYRLHQGKGVTITGRYRYAFGQYDYALPTHNLSGFYFTAGIPIKGQEKEDPD